MARVSMYQLCKTRFDIYHNEQDELTACCTVPSTTTSTALWVQASNSTRWRLRPSNPTRWRLRPSRSSELQSCGFSGWRKECTTLSVTSEQAANPKCSSYRSSELQSCGSSGWRKKCTTLPGTSELAAKPK